MVPKVNRSCAIGRRPYTDRRVRAPVRTVAFVTTGSSHRRHRNYRRSVLDQLRDLPRDDADQTRTVWGGFVSFLAIALLVHTLKRRLDTYQLVACPIPA